MGVGHVQEKRGGDPEIEFFIMCDILNSLSKILNERDDGDDVVTHPQQQQQKRETKTSSLSLSLSLSPLTSSTPTPSTHLICVYLIHIWKTSDIVTTHDGKPAKSSHKLI
jgi:hypothetical protein